MSPDGLKLAYGNAQSFVADFRTSPPVEQLLLEDGYSGYWLTNDALMVTQVTNANGWWNRFLYRVPTLPSSPWISTPQSAVFANWFDAADGHWGANVANGPVTYDGVQVLDRGHGISIAGELLATMQDEEILIRSAGQWAIASVKEPPHTFKINAQGYLTYGRGMVWVRLPSGEHVSVTATPWVEEYNGLTLLVDGQPWVWTGTTDPSNGVPMILGRPLGDDNVIVVNGVNFAGGLSVVYQPGLRQFVVAGANTNGWLLQRTVPVDAPRVKLEPTMPPFPRKLYFGSFYAFSSRYGSVPAYPQNATVVVTEKHSDGTLYSLDHVKEAAALLPIIVDPGPEMLDYIKAHALQDRVKALYIGDTGGWEHAEEWARDAKARWRALFGGTRPVLWYITPGEPNRPGFQIPPSVDILGPEFYFPDVPLARMEELRWRLLGWWISKLGSSIKPWMPICQAFDRGNPNFINIDAVTAMQPRFFEQLTDVDPRIGQLPPAIGVLMFAANRPGGALTHADWAAWHKAMRQSLPPGLPDLPAGGVTVGPKITIVEPSSWPVSGPAPFKVRCVAAQEPGSGPVDLYIWLYRQQGTSTWLVAAQNESWDSDHTYTFAEGAWEIALQGKGPGGTAQTQKQRVATATSGGGGGGGGNGGGGPTTTTTLKTFHGQFWALNGAGKLVQRAEGVKFDMISRPGGKVAFKAPNGKYVCAEGGGTENYLIANRDAIATWEEFVKGPSTDSSRPRGFTLKADNGKYVCAEGDGRITCQRPAAATWEVFEPEGGGGGGGGTVNGRVRVDNHRFVTDAGWWSWRGVSDFDAIWFVLNGRQGELEERLDAYVRAGRTCVRVLGMLSWSHRTFSPRTDGYWDAVQTVVQLVNDRGMYVNFCFFADAQIIVPGEGEREAWLDQFASFCQTNPGVIPQLANEPFKNGWAEADDPALLELADRLAGHLGHRDFSIGDPVDGDNVDASEETTARLITLSHHSRILVLHPSRMEAHDGRFRRWVDHLEGITDVLHELNGGAFVHDEPMGASTTHQPGRRDSDPDAHVAAQAVGLCCGLGYTYHWITEELSVNDLPGFYAAADVLAQIPVSPDWGYKNDSWEGAPTQGYETVPGGLSGKIRHLVRGGEAWTVGYGDLDWEGINWRSGWVPTVQFAGNRVRIWSVRRP